MCKNNKCSCENKKSADIQILIHHIYEYKKGIRNLVLHTMKSEDITYAQALLNKHEIDFCLQKVTTNKTNVFFGREECVDIVKTFANSSLSNISDELDFMLGVMLGYDRMQQCQRYIKRRKDKNEITQVNKATFKYSIMPQS